MAKVSKKTKPVGVRFDLEIMEELGGTAQNVLIVLESFYKTSKALVEQQKWEKENNLFSHEVNTVAFDKAALKNFAGTPVKINSKINYSDVTPESYDGGANFNRPVFDEVEFYEAAEKQTPYALVGKEWEETVIDVTKSEIHNQITAIKAEKIPKERDTSLGRKIWHKEQSNRISQLQKQIK